MVFFQNLCLVIALAGANPLPKGPSFTPSFGSGLPSLPTATPSFAPGLTPFPSGTPSLPTGLPSFTPKGVSGSSPLVARDEFGSSTQNGLTDGTACKKVSLIFARGTSEQGNMGSVVGPPLASHLASAIGSGNLAVQGVEYSASAAGAASGGDASGASKMTSLADDVVKKCPDTQVVLGGYSQGAQLVHKAGSSIASSTAAQVKAVVVFGDPLKGQAIKNIDSGIVKTYCHEGDEVCSGTFVITQAHLTYGDDTPDAASFIKGKVTV
ncbi:cutinase-domain-containing protein [Phyllosticta citribraziliensis]|uniref:Cutinase n=1 Tax=Phyllosticta citribraziliensis TaxID=989973 RepID=A0ABR1LHK2_9PEZI